MFDQGRVLDGDEGHPRLPRAEGEVGEVRQRVAQEDADDARAARAHLFVSVRRLHEHDRGVVRAQARDRGIGREQARHAHELRADGLAGDDAVPPGFARRRARGSEEVRRELRRLKHHRRANLPLHEHVHRPAVDPHRVPERPGAALEDVGEELAVLLRRSPRALGDGAHAKRAVLARRGRAVGPRGGELVGFARDVAKLLPDAAAGAERGRARGRREHPERGAGLLAAHLVPRRVVLRAQRVDPAREQDERVLLQANLRQSPLLALVRGLAGEAAVHELAVDGAARVRERGEALLDRA